MNVSISNDENEEQTHGRNQTCLRANNEKLVLTLLRRDGAMAKAELAKKTGLSAQTLTVLIRSLEEQGLVQKGEPEREGRVGQPRVPFDLRPEGAHFLGLKIGRRSAEMVLIDFVGNVLAQCFQAYDYPTAQDLMECAVEGAKDLQAEAGVKADGMGVAMPSLLWNWADEIGVAPEAMAHWKETDVKAELGAHFDFPIFLQNDATAACGAELIFGSRPLPNNFIHLYIGFFIGGGIVLDRRLLTGPTGNAGAIGPMLVQTRSGERVPLMEKSSIALLEKYLCAAGIDSHLLWEVGPWDFVPEKTKTEWIEAASFALAQASIASLSIFDFEAIVIDGWIPEQYRAEIVARTKANIKTIGSVGVEIPPILEGTMGASARAMGAASLPLSDRFMIDFNAL